ncbi:MAG TPA: type II toxin-antitoxin system HicB family antitoxin [Ignavibacteriaceae bacterium]|nr:type II toxin-antitoxin system HicB family antitoxin [Ignavibacteriaceae bacterium]
MKMKKERVFDTIIHEAKEGGFWGECPVLKGCYSQGDTLSEVKEHLQEAIELYIEELEANKKKVPRQMRTYIVPIEIQTRV